MKRMIAVLFVVLLSACVTLTATAFAAQAAQSEQGYFAPRQDAVRTGFLPADADPIADSGAVSAEDGEVVADGINTNVATIWIVAGCSVVFISVITVTVILAKRNKSKK